MPFDRPGSLQGPKIRLEPLSSGHREELRAVALIDQTIWDYFPINYNGAGSDFDRWFDHTLEKYALDEHHPFAVKRVSDNAIIGTTRFYDLAPDHRRLAIGSTWYAKDARGTLVNSEVRLLTLSFAFERLSVNRVELITDPRNLSSQAAMKLLGAVYEGTIRNHLIYKSGRIRDSLLFSIIGSEWASVKQRLLDKLDYDSSEVNLSSFVSDLNARNERSVPNAIRSHPG